MSRGGAWCGVVVGRADDCGDKEFGPSPSSVGLTNLQGTLFSRAECSAVGREQE